MGERWFVWFIRSVDGAAERLLRLPSTMPYEGTPSSGRHTIPMDSPLMYDLFSP